MCSQNVCPRNVELYWSKFAAYHRKNLMLKTLNPEILKNSPGWVWVAKKVWVGSSMPYNKDISKLYGHHSDNSISI